MIGLDANVLLAWLLSGQSRPLPQASGYRVTHVALAELVWVLSRTFKYSRASLILVIQSLQESADLLIDRYDVVNAAFQRFQNGKADFADFLIARDNEAAGCGTTVTLDKKAAREPGFTHLKS